MADFEIVVDDSLYTLVDNPWKQTTEFFEYRFAVKWYAVSVFSGDERAGFMHVVRHPEREEEWYICDVHTIEKFRGQGVASLMYQKAFELVSRYDKAYRITASVKNDNTASLKLHEKMGFHDTGEDSVFPELVFEDGETMHEYYFATKVPARATKTHGELLCKLGCPMDSGKKACLVFAGDSAVGYTIGGDTVLLPEWEKHQKDGCLHIEEMEVC